MKHPGLYKQCFQAIGKGAIITDDNAVITAVNPAAEKLLGINQTRVIGAPITEILPAAGKKVLTCLQNKTSELYTQIHERDVPYILDVNILQIQGELKGALCALQPMDQFEMYAEKLDAYQNLNRQLEAIYNASSDGIWVLDKAGRVISMNEAAERVEGFKKDEVVGKKIDELLEKGFVDQAVTPKVLQHKKTISVLSYKKRTQKTLLVTGTPVLDNNGDVSLIIVNERDMTELTAMKEKLELSNMVTEKIKEELSEYALQDLKDNKIIAVSKAMHNILHLAMKLSQIEALNILISGKSGTGKSLLAKFLHSTSQRKKKAFIEINCAAIPESLLEAELFGYEKGAFTGAKEKGKAGLFELAHEGTLFLDEIGDMPLVLQAKLLKYLDDKRVMRLGGTQARKIDCIVIAATNQNLVKMVKEKRFRKDLFYRLNAFTLKIPALKERPEDTLELVRHYIKTYNDAYGKNRHIGPEGMALLQDYGFPGNVRELKNMIRKAVVFSEEPCLDSFLAECINIERASQSNPGYPMAEKSRLSLTDELFNLEHQILKSMIPKCRSTSELAERLSVSQPTAFRKMKKHGFQFNNE